MDNSDWVAFDQDLFDRKKSPDYDPEEYTLVGYVEAAEKGRVELVVGDYGVFELVTPTGRYRAHAVLNEEAGDGFVVKLVGHWFSTGEELEVITGGTPSRYRPLGRFLKEWLFQLDGFFPFLGPFQR